MTITNVNILGGTFENNNICKINEQKSSDAPLAFPFLQSCFESAVAPDDDQTFKDRQNREMKMSSTTGKLLEQLFMILHYMYKDDMKFVEDFRYTAHLLYTFSVIQNE